MASRWPAACVLVGAAAWAWVANDPADRELRYAPEAPAQSPADAGRVARGFADLRVSQHLADFLRAGRVRRRGVPVHRPLGPFSGSASAAATVGGVLGDDRVWAVASPLAGYCSDRLGRRKPIICGAGAAAGWATLLYAPLPLVAFDRRRAHQLRLRRGRRRLCLRQGVGAARPGTISGAVNVGCSVPPCSSRRLAGCSTPAGPGSGPSVYGADAFQAAFAMIVLWSCLLIAFTKETGCRQTA
jgi:hypothetical protein